MDVKKVNDSVQLTGQLKPVSGHKPGAKGVEKVVEADRAAKGDALDISAEAQEKAKIARYVRIVKQMPEIRDDKVAEAKKKLASGQYKRPDAAKKIADRMLKD